MIASALAAESRAASAMATTSSDARVAVEGRGEAIAHERCSRFGSAAHQLLRQIARVRADGHLCLGHRSLVHPRAVQLGAQHPARVGRCGGDRLAHARPQVIGDVF